MESLCEAKDISELGCNLITWGLYLSYAAFAIAFLAAIILPLINSLKNPASLVKVGAGVLALVILFAIGYSMSSGSLTPVAIAQGITENGSKMIGAGLISFYACLIITILGLVYSEISKAFK